MDFYQRVHLVCERIPRGKVASYGQIALLCGYPRHARRVGYALRSGRAGNVPAHRIVNAAGVLSGAKAFPEAHLQQELLKAEGVEVKNTDGSWRVDLRIYGWNNTMEEAEYLRSQFLAKGI